MQLLNGVGFTRLETAIYAANMRQSVLSNNIANNDTPNFKRSNVSFESMLQQAAEGDMPVLQGKRTNTRHFVIGPSADVPAPLVTTDKTTSMNNNLNNVDIDSEMSQLAENQLRYNTYIEQINYQIKMMRNAVEGR